MTVAVWSEDGEFLGFRVPVPAPEQGPPTPIVGHIERTVGDVVITRTPGGWWYLSNIDADYGDSSVDLNDETLDAVLNAIAEMRTEPFPQRGWRYPNSRVEKI